MTNSTTSEWALTDDLLAPARFYRLVGPQAAPQKAAGICTRFAG